MSYRNPKIIDDKSGLIVSQAIDKAVNTLGQGIVAFGAEEKRREEIRKKEQERRDKIYIGLANEMAENSTIFNEGIKKGSNELRNILIPRNEMLLKRINDIKIQQQINGNRDPELSKELSNLRTQISDGNIFAESYIETASLLTKTMEDPQAFVLGEKTFTMINGSQDEAETIFNAVGGNPNYTTSFTSDLSVIVTNKGTGKSFKNTREQFEAKAKNLYITKKNNTADQETELMNSKIYNEDGSVKNLLLENMPVAVLEEEKDGDNYVARYRTQTLNQDMVMDIKRELVANTFAYVESFVSKQEQGLYLKDIGITGNKLKEYQDGDDKDRKKLIEDSSDLLFKRNSGVTEKDNKYFIKTKIGNSTRITSTKATDKQIDRQGAINTIRKNFDASNKTEADFAEAIKSALGLGKEFIVGDDGNITLQTDELDQAAMDAATVETDASGKVITPKIYKEKIFTINSDNPVVNRNTLTNLLKEKFKLSHSQADDLAKELLKKKKIK